MLAQIEALEPFFAAGIDTLYQSMFTDLRMTLNIENRFLVLKGRVGTYSRIIKTKVSNLIVLAKSEMNFSKTPGGAKTGLNDRGGGMAPSGPPPMAPLALISHLIGISSSQINLIVK